MISQKVTMKKKVLVNLVVFFLGIVLGVSILLVYQNRTTYAFENTLKKTTVEFETINKGESFVELAKDVQSQIESKGVSVSIVFASENLKRKQSPYTSENPYSNNQTNAMWAILDLASIFECKVQFIQEDETILFY
jgi:hypothetical protein